MTIKVYNNNGSVRVTKVIADNEYCMFHDVADGEAVTIELKSHIGIHAEKCDANPEN